MIYGLMYARIIYVNQSGHGDYTSIQRAIDASALEGDTIIVFPGIYNECLDFEDDSGSFHWVTVQSLYPQTHSREDILRTVIHCNNFGGGGIITKWNGTLNGFTITNDEGDGIEISYHLYGGEIDPYNYYIDNCIISHNGMNGILIYSDWSAYHINNCEITDNNGDGLGQYEYNEPHPIDGRQYSSEINNSLIANNYGYGVYSYWDVKIRNCTITRNEIGFLANTSSNLVNTSYINSSIIYDNRNGSISTFILMPFPQISFSDIHDYQNPPPNQGIIDNDPCFVDSHNNDFSLAWDTNRKSPCIDTGDPNPVVGPLLDPDLTRLDMGYKPVTQEWYTHVFHGTDEYKGGWNWMCFPVLDVYDINPQIGNVMQHLAASGQLDHVEWSINNQILEYLYDSQQGEWIPYDHVLQSTQGYKVQLSSRENYGTFYITAPRCPASTPIHLYGPVRSTGQYTDNWIGYFLPFSQRPEDALASIWSQIYSISTQTWAMARYGSGWLYTGSKIRQFNDGDMVIIQCYNEVPNFVWNQGTRQVKAERQKAEYFSYTEQSDYLPIFVAVGNEPDLEEVAVFANGECRGAVVVEDSLMEINAYVLDLPEDTELEIAKYYNSRQPLQHITSAYVYDKNTDLISFSKIKLHKNDDYLYIGTSLSQMIPETQSNPKITCFPNPFNPSTTIEYSVTKSGVATIEIFNVKGQLVKTVWNGKQEAGTYKMRWDGMNQNGKSVGSGIYFAKLKSIDGETVKKLILLK